MTEGTKPSDEVTGLFFAMIALAMGAIEQEALNREKLIDHLVRMRATVTPKQAGTHYSVYLDLMIEHLEASQFGFPNITDPKLGWP